jgi:hypothetical protein
MAEGLLKDEVQALTKKYVVRSTELLAGSVVLMLFSPPLA